MSSPVEVPRRIVKKRGGHGGHHGGAWKVAYADFVTAMMALFIVLWIVGQSKDVKDSVAAYFKDPSAFQKGSSKLLKGGEGAGGALPAMPIPAPPPSEPEKDKKRGDRETLEAAASSLREQIHREAHLALLEDKIKIELTDEGLRIQLMETGQGAFFDVGSAKVKPSTREVLAIIAREVGKLPNEVIMEGHTDTRPYVGQPSYTNWELSADRANAARRILEIEGLRHAQIIRVVGYADRQLANRDDPLDAANRRISIIVNFRKESSRAAGPREPRAAS